MAGERVLPLKRYLKPCPFCGETDRIIRFNYPFPKPGLKGCYVCCESCGAATGRCETVREAEDAWNQRMSGEWSEYGEHAFWECSCCGKCVVLIEGTPAENGYSHCPSCGAEMTMENTEDEE